MYCRIDGDSFCRAGKACDCGGTSDDIALYKTVQSSRQQYCNVLAQAATTSVWVLLQLETQCETHMAAIEAKVKLPCPTSI